MLSTTSRSTISCFRSTFIANKLLSFLCLTRKTFPYDPLPTTLSSVKSSSEVFRRWGTTHFSVLGSDFVSPTSSLIASRGFSIESACLTALFSLSSAPSSSRLEVNFIVFKSWLGFEIGIGADFDKDGEEALVLVITSSIFFSSIFFLGSFNGDCATGFPKDGFTRMSDGVSSSKLTISTFFTDGILIFLLRLTEDSLSSRSIPFGESFKRLRTISTTSEPLSLLWR
mmetsp:Transcript_11291/g.16882  ORF Transcript_11291/g.16882 Transcript_11291/m.16882 type:complete len:227 (-) Transcript_11291:1431-2111(-)